MHTAYFVSLARLPLSIRGSEKHLIFCTELCQRRHEMKCNVYLRTLLTHTSTAQMQMRSIVVFFFLFSVLNRCDSLSAMLAIATTQQSSAVGFRHFFTKSCLSHISRIIGYDDQHLPDVPNAWIDLAPTSGCVREMRRQIQAEIDASLQYLAMGAHFAQDTVNRPGFMHFFFKAAGEEREHAHKLIEYLLMRGQLLDNVSDLIKIKVSTGLG